MPQSSKEEENSISGSNWGRFLEELMFEHDLEGLVGLKYSIEGERYSREGGSKVENHIMTSRIELVKEKTVESVDWTNLPYLVDGWKWWKI